MKQPWDFGEAFEADQAARADQRAAEQFVVTASERLAEAERVYKIALAQKITELHAKGVAWTTCGDLGRGNEQVARLRYERDLAKGVKEAAEIAAWRASANRRATEGMMDWSMRRDLAEGRNTGDQAAVQTFGRRAA